MVAVDYDSDLLPFLLQEFPFLNISTETLHKMWRDGAQHLKYIAASDSDLKQKKNRFQRAVRDVTTNIRSPTLPSGPSLTYVTQFVIGTRM